MKWPTPRTAALALAVAAASPFDAACTREGDAADGLDGPAQLLWSLLVRLADG